MKKITRAAAVAALSLAAVAGTAAAASAATPTQPVVRGVITAPHTVVLDHGQVAVPGEVIRPQAAFYYVNLPVTAVTVLPDGQEQITTGSAFLPLYLIGHEVNFTVVHV